jgi:hypothetical protein
MAIHHSHFWGLPLVDPSHPPASSEFCVNVVARGHDDLLRDRRSTLFFLVLSASGCGRLSIAHSRFKNEIYATLKEGKRSARPQAQPLSGRKQRLSPSKNQRNQGADIVL